MMAEFQTLWVNFGSLGIVHVDSLALWHSLVRHLNRTELLLML